MNTLHKTLLALSAGTLMSAGAHAAVNYGYTGQPYVGVKAGQFMLDEDGGVDLDDPTAYGVYGGYTFDPNFGMELEYVTSSDADFTQDNGVSGEYSLDSLGAYGTYRYYFPNTSGLYAKGKLGVARTEIDVDYDSDLISDDDDSDTALAGGLGLGFAVSPNASIEGEYAMSSGDIEADMFTVGAHLKF